MEAEHDTYDLSAVHGATLKILKEVDRICRKYQIQYLMDSGTLLGAVRHEGFIPWDDDADLSFTRDNYEAFARVVRRELPPGMKFLEPHQLREGKAFFDFTPRIVYLQSRTHEDDEEMQFYGGRLNHIYVDLFIQDELPEGKIPATFARGLQTVIYGLAMGHRYRLDYSKYGTVGKVGVKVLSTVGRILPMKLIFGMQYRAATMYNKGKSQLRYYSNYQPDYLYVTLEKQWNDEIVDIPFEDAVLMAPKGWDAVLRWIYGDYMQLPPKEKRVPSHSTMEIQVWE